MLIVFLVVSHTTAKINRFQPNGTILVVTAWVFSVRNAATEIRTYHSTRAKYVRNGGSLIRQYGTKLLKNQRRI